MIGQEELQKHIKYMIDVGSFPRFVLIVGGRGGGKRLLVKKIAEWLNAYFVESSNGVDDVRNVIEQSYKVYHPTAYSFYDIELMSVAARNALLKVTEEPPNNAYFVMTTTDENRVIDTIRSRAVILYMDKYSVDEILEYARKRTDDSRALEIVKDICDTPGEVDTLIEEGVEGFDGFVRLVFDNVAEVSGANALKIANKLKLKDDADGYDLKLFWKTFIKYCVDTAVKLFQEDKTEEGIRYCKWASHTTAYLEKLRVSSLSKAMLVDNWIMEIRKLSEV